MKTKEMFRKLPKVDILLKEEKIQMLCEEYGRGFVTDCIRAELDELRAKIVSEDMENVDKCLADFAGCVENRVKLELEDPL